MTYYLYSVHREDVADDCPTEKREWWFLRNRSDNKQELIDWRNKFGGPFKFKLIQTDLSIKDFFYPKIELKTRSHTAKVLKSVSYTAD